MQRRNEESVEHGEARAKSEPASGLTRRRMLVGGAAAAGVAVTPALGALGHGALAAAASSEDSGSSLTWEPRFLDTSQAELLTRLCDLLLPRTTTPGALDAGVPEWIDLAVSLADSEEQLTFLGGLAWIDRRAKATGSKPFLELSEAEQTALLREISDQQDEHADELEPGAAFFVDLKNRALFALYTSKTGRVELLGLPEKVERETLEGCPHGPEGHEA